MNRVLISRQQTFSSGRVSKRGGLTQVIVRWYQGYLRLLVWGEDPHIGERRVADWSEHLEDFRAQRSYFTFLRELIFGSVAHLIFRLSDRSATSTAVIVLALASGVVTTAASSFVGNSVVSFTVAADLHSTCLLYTSPSPRDRTRSRMPSSA